MCIFLLHDPMVSVGRFARNAAGAGGEGLAGAVLRPVGVVGDPVHGLRVQPGEDAGVLVRPSLAQLGTLHVLVEDSDDNVAIVLPDDQRRASVQDSRKQCVRVHDWTVYHDIFIVVLIVSVVVVDIFPPCYGELVWCLLDGNQLFVKTPMFTSKIWGPSNHYYNLKAQYILSTTQLIN